MTLFRLLLLAACALACAGQTINGRVARVQLETLSTATASSSFNVSQLAPAQHTVAVAVSGSPTGCALRLEGSLDGTTWFDLSGSQTCTSSLMFHVASRPVDFVRVNVTTLSGGTSPTVALRYLGVQ